MRGNNYATAVSFLILITTLYYSFYSLTPHNAYNGKIPLSQFSTNRALSQLKAISKEPHYTGTAAHTDVRKYITGQLRDLGLDVEVQEQFATNKKFRAATINKNIVARIKGSDSGKALLLLSHYDSAPGSSPGASDDGSGVVTLLEGVRAFLANNKTPKNDIIILITDAEELGLIGASAFVNYHPWAKDIGLVINFEARGTGGPSYMLMETNGGNKNMIEQFQKARPQYPVATSLLYSIYKMLPNDTDLTVFREDGDIEGFNFAFIDDHYDYHTAQDSFERLDITSLEHQASYLMPLLDYFANADLSQLKSDTDYVYFNFPLIGMAYYPFAWVWPMLIVMTLGLLVLLFWGFSKKTLTMRGILKGFIPLLLSLIVSGIFAFYGWQLLKKIYPQYNDILQGFTYNGHWYIAAFSALTVAVCFGFYKRYFKSESQADLLIAPLILWFAINIVVAIYLKGAAYFIIAVAYGLIALAILLLSATSKRPKTVLLTILASPVLILFSPMIETFPVGLGLKILVVSTTFIVLLFGLLVPVFSNYKNVKMGRLLLLLSLILFTTASFKSSYNKDRKKPNSLNYVLDADKNAAYWITYNYGIDDYTRLYLGDSPEKGTFERNTNASKYGSKIKFYTTADIKDLPPPEIRILDDSVDTNYRYIQLQIKPRRQTNRIDIMTLDTLRFKTLKINGEPFQKEDSSDYVLQLNPGQTLVNYYVTGPADSLAINFRTDTSGTLRLIVEDIAFDLLKNPDFNVKPRSEIMMPMPFVINDATIIKKEVSIPEK